LADEASKSGERYLPTIIPAENAAAALLTFAGLDQLPAHHIIDWVNEHCAGLQIECSAADQVELIGFRSRP
jgi:hypothetical protein